MTNVIPFPTQEKTYDRKTITSVDPMLIDCYIDLINMTGKL